MPSCRFLGVIEPRLTAAPSGHELRGHHIGLWPPKEYGSFSEGRAALGCGRSRRCCCGSIEREQLKKRWGPGWMMGPDEE